MKTDTGHHALPPRRAVATLGRSMPSPIAVRSRLSALVAISSVVALVLLLSATAPAGAGPSRASEVNVVGSGTLASSKVAVYAKPSTTSRRVTTLSQFRPDFRHQYVLALEARTAKSGKPTWYRISYPGRPNGQTGWVRASSVEIRPVQKRLVIYRGARKFELWDGQRLLRTGRVAVGKPGAETPLGLFYVTWKFSPKIDPDWAILGDFAFETSAYSKLTDWPGGGIVGVHGTPWPNLLGQAVSHGCVRLHNRDIRYLKSHVPLGTPVKIVR
jgi:lipoprotein-anchoring transpeptidase ErfK/SrfK